MRTTAWRFVLAALCAPLLSLSALVLVAPTAEAATTLNAVAQGWYQYTGYHDATNANYFTGRQYIEHFRSFVAFDLSGVTAPVEAATFSAPSPTGYLDSAHPMYLREVTTTLAALNTSHASADPTGLSIYSDLGDGTVYGTYSVSAALDPVVVELNDAGVAAVNANLGGVLVLGTDIPSAEKTYYRLFGGTDATTIPRLILQSGGGNSAPVAGTVALTPDPASAGEVTFTATPSGFSDPDGDPFTYHYAWTVNGSTAGTDSATLIHTVVAGDVVAVSVTASDGFASSAAATDEVTVSAAPSGDVVEAIEDLRESVESYDLGKTEFRLVKLLDGAVKDLDKGDPASAIEKMYSFVDMVEAQAGKQIPVDAADDLVQQAQDITILLQL